MRYLPVAVAVLMLSAACGDTLDSVEQAPSPESPAQVVPNATESTLGTSSDSGGEDGGEVVDEPPTTLSTETGEPEAGDAIGDLVASIKADAVALTGAAAEEISVIRSESVTWNDGSLGCPVPGQQYTMALVNGYWVVLVVDGVEYDYRANDRGDFRLCEGAGNPPSNPTQ